MNAAIVSFVWTPVVDRPSVFPTSPDREESPVPIYEFRCGEGCGRVERSFPMASAPAVIACPVCGCHAGKQFGSTAIGHAGSPAMRLLDAAASTADTPHVTSRVPAAGGRGQRRPISTDPRHRRLPRP